MISLVPSLPSFHTGPPPPQAAPAHIVTPPPTTHCLSIQYWAEGMPYFLQPETQESKKEVRVRLAGIQYRMNAAVSVWGKSVHRHTEGTFSWRKAGRKTASLLLLHVCGLSAGFDSFDMRNGSINPAPPVYLHSALSECCSVIFSVPCKRAHLQEGRHACHQTARRQSRPVTGPAESTSDVQGLERIFPVAGIHLLVWSESDSGALLIYAETCTSTGTLEFSGGGESSLSEVM